VGLKTASPIAIEILTTGDRRPLFSELKTMKLFNLFNLPPSPTQIPNLQASHTEMNVSKSNCPLNRIRSKGYASGDLEQIASATQFCLTLL
jgi:hypothetical protein